MRDLVGLTPIRFLGIGLGMSVMIGMVVFGYLGAKEMIRVAKERAEWEQIERALKCGASKDDASLEAIKNAQGNYNLSRLGCGPGWDPNGDFTASRSEIERARQNDPSLIIRKARISWLEPTLFGLAAAGIANIVFVCLAMFLVIVRSVLVGTAWKKDG